ncbi:MULTISPECIES: ABC transporter permease [unclassified Granulicatella]|uniref:ABC transporter permease n=1 Tax=unclassified Granulicatella TaxID=2630493 RepID=UPI00107363FA|nr:MULTISPECIES: FtsX-like permease family protein [unclassified Granulicatella]MBF0779879.1 ABC transporter permease [Granulicatella sp. 19428wC4_WM01]TFU96083.1 ABC transporter permease [Granulicatella sp. WM01]
MSILNKLTLAHLKENKKRTFLTGLSITTVVALLTAIVIFLSSAWLVMYDGMTHTRGNWHFATQLITQTAANDLASANFISNTLTIPAIDATDDQQHTFSVQTYRPEQSSLSIPVTTYRGHLPKNENEVVLSSNVETSDNELIGKHITLHANGISKTYTIVGLSSYSPTPIAYILNNDFNSNHAIMYAQMKDLNASIFDVLKHYSTQTKQTVNFYTNNALLGLFFIYDKENIPLFFSFDIISGTLSLILIITLVITVTIIHSSFSLSLGERIKQLGALSSVGTTRIQITKMMLLEAFWIGSISIILGMIIGYIGSVISLNIFTELAKSFDTPFQIIFRTVLYAPALVGIVVFSALIILLSALIPSIRAAKRSPIDNIKQVPFKSYLPNKIKQKKHKKSGVFYSLFGIPAFLANRYTHHNHSRSRTVFVTLTISLLTFNVITNMVVAMQNQLSSATAMGGFQNSMYSKGDLVVLYHPEDHVDSEKVSQIDGVTSVYSIQSHRDNFLLSEQPSEPLGQYKDTISSIYLALLSKDKETEVLKKANVTPDEFRQKGILVSSQYKRFNQQRITPALPSNLLKNYTLPLMSWQPIENETQSNSNTSEENSHHLVTQYINLANNINGDELSFGLEHPDTIIVSQELFDTLVKDSGKLYITNTLVVNINNKENAKIISEQIKTLYPNVNIYSSILHRQSLVNLMIMFQIIAYGFISLVSIICLTTLFNTMSSNIRLRRREFSMLRSVGMTNKQIRTMLSIENLKTGSLSLLVAIILSVIVTLSAPIIETYYANQYPIFPTVFSSIAFISILLLFNSLSIRQSTHYSLVDDITNETF